jgi:hypothetical protein
MNTEIPVLPVSAFKPKMEVIVIDPKHDFFNKKGTVVSTATTAAMEAVSVKFPSIHSNPSLMKSAVWFYSNQLAKVVT